MKFTRTARMAVMTPVAVAGFALAVFVGLAIAKTFTLNTAKNAPVANQATPPVVKHEAIVVTSKGWAVYYLATESKRHPLCTKASGCWGFWPPVKVKAGQKPSAAIGIKGKLTVWHHSGIFQVLLSGHPLYTFVNDTKKRNATGEGFVFSVSPRILWHVITPTSFKHGANVSPAPGPAPNPNPYPPPPPGW